MVPRFGNGRSYAPTTLKDFEMYPEASTAVSHARSAGFLTIVITNQPDVGSGIVAKSVVEEMHCILRSELKVDDVEVCYEANGGVGRRRKPNPGMILDAAERWNISLERSFVIGDRASDIQAAQRAGCRSIFIDRGYSSEPKPEGFNFKAVDAVDAVAWCVAQGGAQQDA